MGQCRTLDADATIGCYYGDYISPFLHPLFVWNQFFPLTIVIVKDRGDVNCSS